MKKSLYLFVVMLLPFQLLPCFSMEGDEAARAARDLSKFPYYPNMGYVLTEERSYTAIQLDDNHVLTSAQIVLGSVKRLCFARTPTLIKEGRDGVYNFDVTFKCMSKTIPHRFCQIIYQPKNERRVDRMLEVKNEEEVKSVLASYFERLKNADLFLRLSNINNAHFDGGDWMLLRLESPLPIQAIPLCHFSSQNLSGEPSICIGGTGIPCDLPTKRRGEKKRVFRLALTTYVPVLQYHPPSGLFYDVFLTPGGQISKSEKSFKNDMLGGPVFVWDGKWVLVGIISTTLGAQPALGIYKGLTDDLEASISRAIYCEFELYSKHDQPAYNICSSLEGLHAKAQELGIKGVKKKKKKKKKGKPQVAAAVGSTCANVDEKTVAKDDTSPVEKKDEGTTE